MTYKSIVPAVIFLFFSLIFIRCADDKTFVLNESKEFEGQVWKQSDSLSYQVDITDTTKRYNLGMTLHHNADYTYQNIYIMIHTTFPDWKRFSKQVNIDIADKSGKWYSDCSGDDCMVEIDIQREAIFNQAGKYVFTIEQFTRDVQLENIESLGFYIENTGKLR